jgi:hypothetical protein
MASQPKNIGHQRGRTKPETPDDQYSEEETARRADEVIKRMLNTPPQPHGKNPKSPPIPKPKERPASKGRVHKGKMPS